MRSQDLLKPDVMSEVILMGAGGLVFAILILIFKKRYRESAGYGKTSVLLGLLAIGMPASVLVWRF